MLSMKTKAEYREIEGIPQPTSGLALLFSRMEEKFNHLPKLAHIALIGLIFLGIFAFFKVINRGHVNITSQGNNAVNMTILLLVCLFLQMLWSAYNGDESQGFGGM